ncbi:MAG: ATP-dependent sacrificial sulfur transferase LarE [Lachnospiraceae bacterium]|jgi:uncharacterized protein|nr:ATP-dependent sacrificial sulfur transferase LarE [Lachnospiraceae bacterium]
MEIQQYDKVKLQQKVKILTENLQKLESLAVAFSSGVDSTFLLKAAHQTLGDRVLAVTVQSNSFPKRELQEAREFCDKERIRQVVVPFDELQVPGFSQNPPERCYLCKKEMFRNIVKTANEYGFIHVAEGSNLDDEGDYRPGMRAIAQMQILSPLREAGFTKREIRQLSREYGIATWDKPSFACLSSRFAYGESITKDKLIMVEQAEQMLWELGFSQVRVRVHGTLARIEVPKEEFSRILIEENRKLMTEQLKAFGFSYVTMDLMGYRMGSMNELLEVHSEESGMGSEE